MSPFQPTGFGILKSRPKLILLLALAVLAAGCGHKAAEDAKPAPASAQPLPSMASAPAPSPTGASATQPPVTSASADSAAIWPAGPIQFVDVTPQAGIRFKHNSGAFGKKYLPETMGSGACFLDYDNDGWQDILFVNSMDWPEHKTNKSFPALYHNNHDGTFTDVTRQAGL